MKEKKCVLTDAEKQARSGLFAVLTKPNPNE